MSEIASISGATEPGRRGVAAFPFYAGPVGIRERDGWLDVAFFAASVKRVTLPVSGQLDGKAVRIVEIATRPIDPSAKQRDAMQAITATVIPA